MRAAPSLHIRLLGELQLAGRDGTPFPLPASQKDARSAGLPDRHRTGASPGTALRSAMGRADDPRAELRWCLSKIRSLLPDSEVRLVADRQRVAVELGNVSVDLLSVRSLLRDGVAAASTDDLKQAASLFGGEFLDGLDLPVCYRYQEWCMAEREAVSRQRLAVLGALVERVQDNPEDALPHARALTVADPLSEAGHAAVVRLLSRVGRTREAASHYERARRIFETELGAVPSGELEEARKALHSFAEVRVAAEPAARGADVSPRPAGVSREGVRLIGRESRTCSRRPSHRGHCETARSGCSSCYGRSRDRQEPPARAGRGTHGIRRRLCLERQGLRAGSRPAVRSMARYSARHRARPAGRRASRKPRDSASRSRYSG